MFNGLYFIRPAECNALKIFTLRRIKRCALVSFVANVAHCTILHSALRFSVHFQVVFYYLQKFTSKDKPREVYATRKRCTVLKTHDGAELTLVSRSSPLIAQFRERRLCPQSWPHGVFVLYVVCRHRTSLRSAIQITFRAKSLLLFVSCSVAYSSIVENGRAVLFMSLHWWKRKKAVLFRCEDTCSTQCLEHSAHGMFSH